MLEFLHSCLLREKATDKTRNAKGKQARLRHDDEMHAPAIKGLCLSLFPVERLARQLKCDHNQTTYSTK